MIFLNIKTSGPDPEKHGILSIGAVDSERTGKESYIYQVPRFERGKEVVLEYLKIADFKEHQLRDPSKPSVRHALKRFSELAETAKETNLAGQNTRLNAEFLKRAMKEHEMSWPFNEEYIDLLTTAINTYRAEEIDIPMREKRIALTFDMILWSVGLERSIGFHHALEDVNLEAEAYSRLVHGRNLIKSLKGYKLGLRDFKNYKPRE